MQPDYKPVDPQPRKRLVRVHKGRKIAGVCAGFGVYFDVDPVLTRLAAVALVLAGGSGILLYIIAWIIMPLDQNS